MLRSSCLTAQASVIWTQVLAREVLAETAPWTQLELIKICNSSGVLPNQASAVASSVDTAADSSFLCEISRPSSGIFSHCQHRCQARTGPEHSCTLLPALGLACSHG